MLEISFFIILPFFSHCSAEIFLSTGHQVILWVSPLIFLFSFFLIFVEKPVWLSEPEQGYLCSRILTSDRTAFSIVVCRRGKKNRLREQKENQSSKLLWFFGERKSDPLFPCFIISVVFHDIATFILNLLFNITTNLVINKYLKSWIISSLY